MATGTAPRTEDEARHARNADVASQLFELRGFLGISQRELARAANLTPEVVASLESGVAGLDDTAPLRAVTDALAEYVNVSRSSDSALRLAEIRALQASAAIEEA